MMDPASILLPPILSQLLCQISPGVISKFSGPVSWVWFLKHPCASAVSIHTNKCMCGSLSTSRNWPLLGLCCMGGVGLESRHGFHPQSRLHPCSPASAPLLLLAPLQMHPILPGVSDHELFSGHVSLNKIPRPRVPSPLPISLHSASLLHHSTLSPLLCFLPVSMQVDNPPLAGTADVPGQNSVLSATL